MEVWDCKTAIIFFTRCTTKVHTMNFGKTDPFALERGKHQLIHTLFTGIENFLNICGEIIVILCLMNSEQS